MRSHNVILTDELERFVAEKIESGAYENTSEVVRASLMALLREHRQREAEHERYNQEHGPRA